MCLGAIYWARLDSVYFGNTCHDAAEVGFDDHFIYEELAVPRNQRKMPMVRLGRTRHGEFSRLAGTPVEDCLLVFCWFFRGRLPSMLAYEHSIAGAVCSDFFCQRWRGRAALPSQ